MSDDAVKEHLLGAFLDEELTHQDVDKLLDLLECEQTRSQACRQAMTGRLISNPQARFVDISSAVRQAVAQEPPRSIVDKPVLQQPRRRRWFTRAGAPVAPAAAKRVRRGWQVPASGAALAASVALVALVVVKPSGTPITAPAVEVAQSAQAVEQPVATAQTQVGAVAQQKPRSAAVMPSPMLRPKNSSAQLVAAGNRPAAGSGGREWVIASPQQSRPVSAQWSLVSEQNTVAQSQIDQQRARQQLNTYLINHARQGGGSALPGALGYARVAARPTQRAGTE